MSQGLGRKLIVVDDEPMLRTLIADRLNALGFEAWAAGDAFEAKKLVTEKDPDAMVVDLDLGSGPTGIELIISIAAKSPEVGFVLLTNFTPSPWELKSAKSMAFVKKSDVLDFGYLVEAINLVLVSNPKSRELYGQSSKNVLSSLTKKQFAVLALLAEGQTNAQIALALKVSQGAIEQSVKRIYLALELKENQGNSKRVAAARIFTKSMGPRRPV